MSAGPRLGAIGAIAFGLSACQPSAGALGLEATDFEAGADAASMLLLLGDEGEPPDTLAFAFALRGAPDAPPLAERISNALSAIALAADGRATIVTAVILRHSLSQLNGGREGRYVQPEEGAEPLDVNAGVLRTLRAVRRPSAAELGTWAPVDRGSEEARALATVMVPRIQALRPGCARFDIDALVWPNTKWISALAPLTDREALLAAEAEPAPRLGRMTPGAQGIEEIALPSGVLLGPTAVSPDGTLWIAGVHTRTLQHLRVHGDRAELLTSTVAPPVQAAFPGFVSIAGWSSGSDANIVAVTPSARIERFDGTRWHVLLESVDQSFDRVEVVMVQRDHFVVIGSFPRLIRVLGAELRDEVLPGACRETTAAGWVDGVGIVLGCAFGPLVPGIFTQRAIDAPWQALATANVPPQLRTIAPFRGGFFYGGSRGALGQAVLGANDPLCEPIYYGPGDWNWVAPLAGGQEVLAGGIELGGQSGATVLRLRARE